MPLHPLTSSILRYKDEIRLDDAIHTAILTLKEGFEGEMTEKNIELGVIQEVEGKKVFRVLSPEEVRDHLNELQ